MDILQQNFTTSFKRDTESFHPAVEGTSRQDSDSDALVCDLKDPEAILQHFELVFKCMLGAAIPPSRFCAELCIALQCIESAIERIIEQGVFPDAIRQNLFLAAVKLRVDAMTSFMDARDAMLAIYDEIEVEEAKDCYWHSSTKTFCFVTLPWPGYGCNRGKLPTQDELVQAGEKGLDLHVRSQRLPRGCLSIVELWRKDVNDVIDSIRQNHDTKEAREQEADLQDSYFALDKDEKSGKTRRQMQVFLLGHLQYEKIRAIFRLEPLSSTANLLDKLMGMTRGSQGRMHFAWQLETYLDIPGMREAEDNVEEELENMI